METQMMVMDEAAAASHAAYRKVTLEFISICTKNNCELNLLQFYQNALFSY